MAEGGYNKRTRDPFDKTKNRGQQVAVEKEARVGITLYDIDFAMMEYMSDVVIPDVEENGTKVKVPLIYGNPERWKAATKDGFMRDQRGRIQIPLVMYKRNSIARDDTLANTMNRNISYSTLTKYNKKQKYDKFSLMNNVQPNREAFNITMPDYVTVSYEVMIWTNFTEHMNKIVEQFQYATDEYWGDKDKYKFRVRIDSFDNQTEVGQGTERIVRTTFTMAVNAYLLPEQFDNKPTTAKEYTPKKVVFGYEADLTGGGGGVNPAKQKTINQYADVLDFLAIRGSVSGSFIDADTMKISNVEVPKLPPSLEGNFDVDNWFKIYINGLFIPSEKYTYYVSSSANQVEFNFSTGSIGTASSTTLGYEITGSDEFGIVGKFKEL
mgnify:FL=1|tara:strand:- start:1530 stop:2672 length:1143 start_codon:yes stop_codon:yes gene_type:complete